MDRDASADNPEVLRALVVLALVVVAVVATIGGSTSLAAEPHGASPQASLRCIRFTCRVHEQEESGDDAEDQSAEGPDDARRGERGRAARGVQPKRRPVTSAEVPTATGSTATVQPQGPTGAVTSDPFEGAASCTLTLEQTEGPYSFDVDAIRSDITEDREGVPLRLAVRVQDADACAPIGNGVVEIWHCDAEGSTRASSSPRPAAEAPGGRTRRRTCAGRRSRTPTGRTAEAYTRERYAARGDRDTFNETTSSSTPRCSSLSRRRRTRTSA